MYMDLFTNHSKPASVGQNHSHCLANYSNSVMIGYSGRKLPCKLLTIIYEEEPLPHSSVLVEFVNLLRKDKNSFDL